MSKKKKKFESEPQPAELEDQQAADQPQAADEPVDAQQECDELLARLQRVSADYLNYQKRMQRDIAQVREFANDELIKALLGVLDDMERALAVASESHDADDPLLAGMQMVHDKALETLGRFGLEVIDAAGEPFDPGQHSAMIQEPSEDHPPQTVLRELQKGYRLKGRTLRPSAVVVSKAPESAEAAQNDAEPADSDQQNNVGE